MTGELSRTGGLASIWNGAAKTVRGPSLWHFCRLTGLRGRGHYGAVEGEVEGKVFAALPAPPRPSPAIHLRYAHKANRTRNGQRQTHIPTDLQFIYLFINSQLDF